jgi:hypothetical protein
MRDDVRGGAQIRPWVCSSDNPSATTHQSKNDHFMASKLSAGNLHNLQSELEAILENDQIAAPDC